MPNATFGDPDLTTFTRLEELGLVVVGQNLTADRAVLECRVAEEESWCRACGGRATSRGSISRSLAHEPFGHRPTTLLVRIRR
ncbi:ISL3 family transposase, partial [Brachybacterium alimentarium]